MTHRIDRLPSQPGTYVLRLYLRDARVLTIGKRGDFEFPAGHYLYVGSAFGSGGLRGRLRHHLRPVTKPHWHIDYLRVAAPLRAIWYTPGQTVYEHTWAKTLLSLADNRVIASGFGASDCRCSTHLIHTAGTPPLAAFQQTTDASLTICDPIE